MHWIRVALGMSAVVMLLGGCGVTSKHPLTDDATSLLDERLIGVWELVPEEGDDAESADGPRPRLYVGRLEGRPNALEAVIVSVEKEKVNVQRMDLFTTKLGEQRYASVGKGETYVIVLYDLKQPDRVTLHFMKEEVVEAAIKKGVLAGKVEVKKGTGFVKIETKTIRITAPPDKLAAWLKAYSPACYGMEQPRRLRRVVFEYKASSARSASPPPPAPPPPDEGGS